jgi:hypothetical protein
MIYSHAMRLRFGLPLLQTIAMFLILWAPWSPETHKFDIVLRDGTEIRGWNVLPGPDQNTIGWAQGINLPALPAEIPIDLAYEKFQQLPELNLRFFSFWFFGALSWYMIGRAAEDIVKWRQTALRPPHWFDLLFAVEALVLAVPSFLILTLDHSGNDLRVLTVWSAIWVALASLALGLRLFQRVKASRKNAHAS